MLRCSQCKRKLTPESPCQACPTCGSTSRTFDETMNGGVVLGGGASSIQSRPGLQSTAELDDDGKITLNAAGPGPRNEEDGLEICARMVRMLNKSGGEWSHPVEGSQDIDGHSTNPVGDELRMQVVRASNNNTLWEGVNKNGSAIIDYNPSTAAREMIEAIRGKSRRYPPEQKRRLILLLDAARTPSHTFKQVLDQFQEQHRTECQKAGFAQVWAVGPHDGLVERLDQ
jgi:hypothetical protein